MAEEKLEISSFHVGHRLNPGTISIETDKAKTGQKDYFGVGESIKD